MAGPRHALTLRSKGQKGQILTITLRLDHILLLHIGYLYTSTLRSKSEKTTSRGYQVMATSAIKTYIRPAWICMSIRLHISLVTHAGCIAAGVGRAFSCVCMFVCLFVCLFVRALQGKWLELSTTSLVHMYTL